MAARPQPVISSIVSPPHTLRVKDLSAADCLLVWIMLSNVYWYFSSPDVAELSRVECETSKPADLVGEKFLRMKLITAIHGETAQRKSRGRS